MKQPEFALAGSLLEEQKSMSSTFYFKISVLQVFISSNIPPKRMGREWATSSKGEQACNQRVKILVPRK